MTALEQTASTARKSTTSRKCWECGDAFEAKKSDSRFCCYKHQQAFHNRSSIRGKVAMPLVMSWRSGKDVGKVTEEQIAEAKTALSTMDPEAKAVAQQKIRRLRERKNQREVASWAFGELCALADEWNRQDRDAGRAMAWQYSMAKMNNGWKAADAF